MNGKEAFLLIRRVEDHFGVKFHNTDLARVWPDLIAIPRDTAYFAVGELMLIWKIAPKVDDVVKEIRTRHMRDEIHAVELARPEGEAMFSVLDAFLSGKLNEKEYISALYAASEQFKNPEYAQQARAREAAISAQNG